MTTTTHRLRILLLCLFSVYSVVPLRAEPPKRDWEPVELVGRATDFWFSRNWRDRYWREDFTFLLTEDGSGKTRRIVSREPTPVYDLRMGTTYTDLKVDWKSKPRVKVIGVKAIDRIPADFYDVKLDDPDLATALIVLVETAPETWKEYYVSNWFHKWGDRADRAIYAHYADRPTPYDVYGFVNGQAAPFAAKSQAILDKNKDGSPVNFHGRIRATKGNAFGYEIELIDLIGRDAKKGGYTILYGDGKTIPRLDGRKPQR